MSDFHIWRIACRTILDTILMTQVLIDMHFIHMINGDELTLESLSLKCKCGKSFGLRKNLNSH
jgi:hypothetical protein